jgi:hypothetical protein
MLELGILFVIILGIYGLVRWYGHTTVLEGTGTVRLQSEHEHFHLHVDLPPNLQVQPGDTLHILAMPELSEGRTAGEVTYTSPVRLQKASWLQRTLVRNSSLIEVKEIVEHP